MEKDNFGIEQIFKKIALISDRVFRTRAKRSSPTPTKKSGAAMASRPCLITT